MRASVDVKLLLDNLKHDDTDVGQWTNVIGYVTSVDRPTTRSGSESSALIIGIQALVLWKVQDLDIAAYENTFRVGPD